MTDWEAEVTQLREHAESYGTNPYSPNRFDDWESWVQTFPNLACVVCAFSCGLLEHDPDKETATWMCDQSGNVQYMYLRLSPNLQGGAVATSAYRCPLYKLT